MLRARQHCGNGQTRRGTFENDGHREQAGRQAEAGARARAARARRARNNTVETAKTDDNECLWEQAGRQADRGRSPRARDNTVETAKPAVEPATREELPRQEAPASQSSKEASRNRRAAAKEWKCALDKSGQTTIIFEETRRGLLAERGPNGLEDMKDPPCQSRATRARATRRARTPL